MSGDPVEVRMALALAGGLVALVLRVGWEMSRERKERSRREDQLIEALISELRVLRRVVDLNLTKILDDEPVLKQLQESPGSVQIRHGEGYRPFAPLPRSPYDLIRDAPPRSVAAQPDVIATLYGLESDIGWADRCANTVPPWRPLGLMRVQEWLPRIDEYEDKIPMIRAAYGEVARKVDDLLGSFAELALPPAKRGRAWATKLRRTARARKSGEPS